MLKLKRAYDPPAPGDGRRFLVERLWPRGVKKSTLRLDAWLKDVAPAPNCASGLATIPESGLSFKSATAVN
jgi:uncharacterized protein YeaO (DUF488 family)